jgi:hypothetical protein
MTVFDLDGLDDADALALVEETLNRYRALRRIYDTAFVERLIRRWPRARNFLLLLLVQPDDPYAEEYWNSVIDDLLLLEPEKAFDHFTHKLRMRARRDMSSSREMACCIVASFMRATAVLRFVKNITGTDEPAPDGIRKGANVVNP